MEPPRSLRRLAQHLHRSATLLNGWSSRWRWQRRLEAYLADQEDRRLRELERGISAATDRHIEIAKLLQEKALERLQTIDLNRLSPDSLAKFLALGVDVERKALGIEKPGTGKVVTRSTVTQFSMSETRELTNHLQERLQKFSPVSRDIMRQIVTKTLRVIHMETEEAAENGEPPTLANSIDGEPDRASKEVGSAGEPGTEPGA
jgi:hypothetical protein